MQSRRFAELPLIAVFAIIYLIAGKIGLHLASLPRVPRRCGRRQESCWLQMLLLGYRVWPAIFVGAFVVNLTTAGHIPTSLVIATGNTFEAVAGAGINAGVCWTRDRRTFNCRHYDWSSFSLTPRFSAVLSGHFR